MNCLMQWFPKFLRSDPKLKKIKSERYRDPNYVQTVCKEIYFTTIKTRSSIQCLHLMRTMRLLGFHKFVKSWRGFA